MQTVGNTGALSTRALVRGGAELCEELVRRSGRALTIPFGNRRMIVSFQWISDRKRLPDPGITPEFSDHDLAKLASRTGLDSDPAWSRGLAIQYGGIGRR